LTYDQQHIYLAFRCLDSEPKKIKASVSNRDNPGNDDWIAFYLDAFNDEISAYFFMVNPLGIQPRRIVENLPATTVSKQHVHEQGVLKR
jgi:hypothetical protein